MVRPILLVPLLAAACAAPQRTVHTASYPTGAPRWQAEMHRGVPDGPTVTWHANGEVASRGQYRAGRKQGEFRYWDRDGRLVRVDRYRDGERIASSRPPATGHAPPSAVAVAPRLAPAPRDYDRYTELRFGFGVGASNAAEVDGSRAGEVGSMSFAVLGRNKARLVGVTAQFAGELFGPSHSYIGPVVGYAGSGRLAHLELLAEGGIHAITGLGDDLFTKSMGDNSEILPYIGLQARLVLDPGDPNGIVFELGAATRTDVTRTRKTVVSETCLIGCSTETQEWELGGSSAEITAGVSYQF